MGRKTHTRTTRTLDERAADRAWETGRRDAYQAALRIAKNRDGEAALDAMLLNDPYVRSTDLALAAIGDACGYSIRVPA